MGIARMEKEKRMLEREFPKSQPILFWLACVCLASCFFFIVNGKVLAAQPIDPNFETEVASSGIYLAQADEQEIKDS